MGSLGHSKRSGVWLHTALAVSAAGVPLGPLHQFTWTRDPKALGKRAVRDKKETADKESQRWLDALAATRDDAMQAVAWYALRWLVERYHYVLKSGCRVERLQWETAERLQRALATSAVVAWRLLWLTYGARRHPEASCEAVLPRESWQVLHQVVPKTTTIPAAPPSLREAVRQIARLGGFLARKGDGEPGVKTIWRGLRRLDDVVTGFRLSCHDPAPWIVGNA